MKCYFVSWREQGADNTRLLIRSELLLQSRTPCGSA